MELSNDKRNEIAIDVSDYWKYNGSDDEFYYNCRDNVECEVGELIKDNDDWNRECDIIMELIENKYKYDNWEARELFENTDVVIVDGKHRIMVNDVIINDVWSIEKNGGEVSIMNANIEICVIGYNDITSIKIC